MKRKNSVVMLCSHSSVLSSTAATATNRATAATTLEVVAALRTTHTATATGSTAATGEECLGRACAALLHLDLNAVHGMGVGVDGSLESSCCLEVDESTVLNSNSQ